MANCPTLIFKLTFTSDLLRMTPPETTSNKFQAWLKRIGLLGFLFFFIKGMVWVAIFMGIGQCFN